jgi:hypothetical protein
VLSDDSDSGPNPTQPTLRVESRKRAAKSDLEEGPPAKRHPSASSHHKIIEILDSSDEEQLDVKLEPNGDHPHSNQTTRHQKFPKDSSGRYIITRKMRVDAVEPLENIPNRWPVPKVDTAYVLDFSDDPRVSEKIKNVNGRPKGLDAFLKAEVCDLFNPLQS